MARKELKESPVMRTASDAITAVFSDNSVSQSETRGRLEELRDEIDTCLDALL